MTWPRILRTLLAASRAFCTLPNCLIRAARKRFPRLCPASSPSPPKRYWKICSSTVSLSARATRQFRRSPGAMIPISSRSLPEEPPSSATVTMAVILDVLFFIPRSSMDSPWPPPMATTRSPRDSSMRDRSFLDTSFWSGASSSTSRFMSFLTAVVIIHKPRMTKRVPQTARNV